MSKLGIIILAAGKGTRMSSEKPKVCFELAGKSLVQRVVNTSLEVNADLIVVVVGYKKELVMDSLTKHEKIYFVNQENQLGTGDAVKSAFDYFKENSFTIFVLCGDVPLLRKETLQKMYAKHALSKAHCTVLTMLLKEPGKYGRIVRDESGNIMKIVEHQDACDEIKKIQEINTGIYCFESTELFDGLNKIDNKNGQKEYYLTDVLGIMYEKGKKIESLLLEDINEALGINSQSQLADLEKEHYNTIRAHWLQNGVTLENPETIIIQDDVLIENDVFISANNMIKGKCLIKKDSYIGPNCVIIDSIIGRESVLEGMNIVKNVEHSDESIRLNWYEKMGI